MDIEIRSSLKPYSHIPGIRSPIVGSHAVLQAFPGKVSVTDLLNGNSEEIFWQIAGQVKNFTCEEDLERKWVRVFGDSPSGYICYRVFSQEKGIEIFLDKAPEGKLCYLRNKKEYELKVKSSLLLPFDTFALSEPNERLSMGVNKAQDWEGIKKRCDFAEIFPFWLKMGNLFPLEKSHSEGTAKLFQECREKIEKKERRAVLSPFQKLFLSSFSGMLVPRLFDEEYQNLVECWPPSKANPFVILREGAHLIRSLFVKEEENFLHLLPCLPAVFTCGRFIGISFSFGSFDMEWSKKIMRRVILRSLRKGKIEISFPPEVEEFRVRTSLQDKGKKFSNPATLLLEKDQNYLLDHFQK